MMKTKSFEELIKLTDYGHCKQKEEENIDEIQNCVEQVLFDYGYEEQKPGFYTSGHFEVRNVDQVWYEIYEYGEKIDYINWIELIDNFEHYTRDHELHSVMDKMETLSDEAIWLINNSGLIDVVDGTGAIHVREQWFLEAFEEYEVERRNCDEYPYRLFTWRNGHKYFCITEQLPEEEE